MEKIRVLYCIETIGWGGVEKRRLTLSKFLNRDQYQIKIICTKTVGGMNKFFEESEVETIPIGVFTHPFQPEKYKKVLRIIKSYKPHIIHGAVFEGNTMASIGGKLGKVPIILLEETSDPINRSPNANRLLKALTWFADKIIAISPSVAIYLKNKAKIKPDKVCLINNGVEIPRTVSPQEVEEVRRRLNIQPEEFIIGSVGRLRNFHKLFTDIIEAVSLLKNKESVKILIVGEGQDRKWIEDTAVRLGLEHQLVMVGLQSDTAPFYKLMDVFCLASHMEGFGLVAAEAMLHRLPVIATAVGGLKDIVVNGETGFLVPSHSPEQIAEKLQILIDQPLLRKSMGEKGRIRAEKEYTAEIYVEKIHQLYQAQLLEKGILVSDFN